MKVISKISSVLLCLLLVVSLATTVFADSAVHYNGDADEFIFKPGDKANPTNLFPDFQNVMPGDVRTEQILIKIKVYLRSKGAQEETDAFLSQMKLTVKQKGESILFQAPADETAQLTDWVYLGMIYSGGEITLDVTLEVPATLDNEFQGQLGYVDWEFKIEEFPVETTDPSLPQTGDSTNPLIYAALMVVSLVIILVLVRKRRKKDE